MSARFEDHDLEGMELTLVSTITIKMCVLELFVVPHLAHLL